MAMDRRSLNYSASEKLDIVENTESLSFRRLSYSKLLTIIGLAFGNFSIGACVSLQAPFFPAEAEKKGATPSEYGFVFAVYQVAIFCFAPIFGKTVNMIPPYVTSTTGIVIVGVSSFLFGILDRASNESFIPLAIIVRVVEGIGAVSVKTASYVLIGMEFKESVTFMFALLETSLGIGIIVGPTIGGLLYQIGGYTAPFAAVGALLMVDACVMLAVLTRSSGESQKSGDMVKFYNNFPLITNAFTVMSVFMYVGLFQTSLEPHLRNFSLNPFEIGCIFVISGTIYAITAPFVGRLCDKGINPRILVLCGCAVALTSQSIIGPVGFIPVETKLWLVILGLCCMGLSIAFKLVSTFVLSLRETIARGFPNDITTYGLVSTLFATSQSIGAFLGPISSGYLYEFCGFRWSLAFMMALEFSLFSLLFVRYLLIRCCVAKEETVPLIIVDSYDETNRRISVFEKSFTKALPVP